KEEEARLAEELKKYDGEYMSEGEAPADVIKQAEDKEASKPGRRVVTLNGSGKATLNEIPKPAETPAAAPAETPAAGPAETPAEAPAETPADSEESDKQ
ncbi:MAG: hypothetical protein IKT31_02330, partial [Firmicutes bacterium]|nr:hypothetical protein [Bacillota bacterium]